MSGQEQERLGMAILICAMAVVGITAVAFLWWIALWSNTTPHEQEMSMRWPFIGLAIGMTLIVVGGPIMLHGQQRKFREWDRK